MNNGHPRLILFDIDCTLLLTGGAGREATQGAMQEIFGTASRIDSHYFGGKTDWQTLVELLEEHGYGEARIGEFMRHYEQAAARHMERIIHRYTIRPCPAALEVVGSLRQRDDVYLGLVTGNVSTLAPLKLQAAGFDPAWFPVGAYGSEARNRDHLPAIAFARAQAHYGHPFEPSHVIVVGDTPADIACARALGAVAVAVGTGYCERAELVAAQPDFLIDDLSTFEACVLS